MSRSPPPLHGLVVADFSELLPGPFLTQNLAELGAEVLKIERPPHGDNARPLAPGVFASVNRGKRSALLDLKTSAGHTRALEIIGRSDILVEAYRPGVMKRLGLDYPTLVERCPKLIYVSLTGYGQSGPMAMRAGHDLNYLATAGATALSGTAADQPRHAFGLPAADLCASMAALAATLAAIVQRAHTGHGQHLDVAIADCVAHWLNPRVGHFRSEGLNDLASQRSDALVKPAYGVFGTRDGGQLSIGALEDHFWARLIKLLPLTPFDTPAFAPYRNRCHEAERINTRLAECIAALDLADAEQMLADADVPCGRVVQPLDVADHEQFVARGLRVDGPHGPFARFPVLMQGMELQPREVPVLGECTTAAEGGR